MQNIEQTLYNIFRNIQPEDFIEGKLHASDIDSNTYTAIMSNLTEVRTETEINGVYKYLSENLQETYSIAESVIDNGKFDIFRIFRYYTNSLLTIQDNEVMCNYSMFLHWRSARDFISEDSMITSFLAHRECTGEHNRTNFMWKPFLTHNNRELHRILDRGIGENHSHLKGAAALFPLTWISIMNVLNEKTIGLLNDIDKDRRTAGIAFHSGYGFTGIKKLVVYAICIRLTLYVRFMIGSDDLDMKKELVGIIKDLKELRKEDCIIPKAVKLINRLILEYHVVTPDYALSSRADYYENAEKEFFVYTGERAFLYQMFKRIYSNDEDFIPYKDMFFAYLIIKERFRGEIEQINNKAGFHNFKVLEGRKDVFLSNDFFKNKQVRHAIRGALLGARIRSYEARIAPKSNVNELKKIIQNTDEWICKGDNEERIKTLYYYTLHFIKDPEDRAIYGECRYSKQRKKYRKEAEAIVALRKRYPKVASRILAIDATNMEIGCPPEVFAHVYRFLTDYREEEAVVGSDKVELPQLRKTYHVGEDYLDVVSGLRAIVEAIKFLELQCGDRLGHAMALGIDANKWYADRDYSVVMSQQEYLDNVVFMHHYITKYNLSADTHILQTLEREFAYYYKLIYGNYINEALFRDINYQAYKHYQGTEWEKYYISSLQPVNMHDYYRAWKLRADDPELYIKGFFDNKSVLTSLTRDYSYYSINRIRPKRQNYRYMQNIALLYYMYQYNPDVHREGAKMMEKKVLEPQIKAINQMQESLQNYIAARGIAIETNPTSNFKISKLSSYAEHPIVRFYNKGLVTDPEILKKCPQLNVSINTDDSGVFGSSLENEYAYLALALEKQRTPEGKAVYKREDIYDWIDNIRKMGLEQSFKKDIDT